MPSFPDDFAYAKCTPHLSDIYTHTLKYDRGSTNYIPIYPLGPISTQLMSRREKRGAGVKHGISGAQLKKRRPYMYNTTQASQPF